MFLRKLLTGLVFCFSSAIVQGAVEALDIPIEMTLVKGGWYTPLYKKNGLQQRVSISSFYMDRFHVTNQQFYTFVQDNLKWQKPNVSSLFADEGYMLGLDIATIAEHRDQPVTRVSWYAAMAFCKSVGKTLPTVDQWEYAAMASSESPRGVDSIAFKRKILDWYAKPASAVLPSVDLTEANYWGIYGMHGVVWEHVSDFNSSLVTGESRGDSALDKQLFCGSGAAQSVDPGDYAAFMRYAMRSSILANYTLASLGFRCAKGI
ncbi:MAG: sulfatase modifying factor 1 [Parasphingorhabdus sp.]|jgi:sulfatase modifying factor 1